MVLYIVVLLYTSSHHQPHRSDGSRDLMMMVSMARYTAYTHLRDLSVFMVTSLSVIYTYIPK